MNAKSKTAKQQRKADNRAIVDARLARAFGDMYANGRVNIWPRVDLAGTSAPEFFDWLGDYARRELDYMSVDTFGHLSESVARISGLSGDYWPTAAHRLIQSRARCVAAGWNYASAARDHARLPLSFPCGPYERARAVLIADGLELLTAPAKRRDGRPYTRAAIYAHGRNGKTIYPDKLATSRIGGFRARDYGEMPYAERVRMVQFVEQFNAHIKSLADDAAAAYTEEMADTLTQNADDLRADIRAARDSYADLARELRTLRGIEAPTACDILRSQLSGFARSVRDDARTLSGLNVLVAELQGAQS